MPRPKPPTFDLSEKNSLALEEGQLRALKDLLQVRTASIHLAVEGRYTHHKSEEIVDSGYADGATTLPPRPFQQDFRQTLLNSALTQAELNILGDMSESSGEQLLNSIDPPTSPEQTFKPTVTQFDSNQLSDRDRRHQSGVPNNFGFTDEVRKPISERDQMLSTTSQAEEIITKKRRNNLTCEGCRKWNLKVGEAVLSCTSHYSDLFLV